jgi:hypothetical protein
LFQDDLGPWWSPSGWLSAVRTGRSSYRELGAELEFYPSHTLKLRPLLKMKIIFISASVLV